MIRPMMTGRAPLSPLRTRRSQIRVYSPSDPASTSGALVSAISAASGASVASGSPATATAPGCSFSASPLSGDDIPQPSEPLLTLPEAAGSLPPPLPVRRRADAPVVIRSTTDEVSNSATGPTAASRPR